MGISPLGRQGDPPQTWVTTACVVLPYSCVNTCADIYVCVVSSAHNVAAPGKFITIASTTVETPEPEEKLALALALLQPIEQK